MNRAEATASINEAWQEVLHLSLNGAPRGDVDRAEKIARQMERIFARKFGVRDADT